MEEAKNKEPKEEEKKFDLNSIYSDNLPKIFEKTKYIFGCDLLSSSKTIFYTK